MRTATVAFAVFVSLGLLSGLVGLARLSAQLNPVLASAPLPTPVVVVPDVATPQPTPVDIRAPIRVIAQPTSNIAAMPTPISQANPWWLLFVMNGDLWETDGTAPVQLTQEGSISQPALTDSGLAFTRRARNASDIWLASAEQPPRPITRNSSPTVAQNHWASEPVFLPGGSRLYVLGDFNKAETGAGDLAVWQLSLEQTRTVQITRPPAYGGGDQDVTVNPANPDQIIFTRYAYTGSTAQLAEQLQWLDVMTSTLVPLTELEHPSRQASFSPEGDQVAFIQQGPGSEEALYVADVALSPKRAELDNARQVATGLLANPAWAPDGSSLTYVSGTGDRFQLWTIPVDRGADGTQRFGSARQLTTGPSIDATSRPVFMTQDQADAVRRWLVVQP
ncbi:MAG: PD40 domain-containing protein [Chloroflexi bacterium]|nr:PD40 domain-containing protein [Chloroflexota bacterium]